jgi:hypothetical protein
MSPPPPPLVGGGGLLSPVHWNFLLHLGKGYLWERGRNTGVSLVFMLEICCCNLVRFRGFYLLVCLFFLE